eukprot:35525-Rhodomonas_salina.1
MAFLTKLGEEEIADLERSLRLTASGLALPPQSYRFCTATNGVSALQGNAGLRVRVPAEHVACLVLRQVYLDVELLVEALLGPAGHFIETLIIAADIKVGIHDILKTASFLSLRSLILREQKNNLGALQSRADIKLEMTIVWTTGVKLEESEVSLLSELVSERQLETLQVHKASLGDRK